MNTCTSPPFSVCSCDSSRNGRKAYLCSPNIVQGWVGKCRCGVFNKTTDVQNCCFNIELTRPEAYVRDGSALCLVVEASCIRVRCSGDRRQDVLGRHFGPNADGGQEEKGDRLAPEPNIFFFRNLLPRNLSGKEKQYTAVLKVETGMKFAGLTAGLTQPLYCSMCSGPCGFRGYFREAVSRPSCSVWSSIRQSTQRFGTTHVSTCCKAV